MITINMHEKMKKSLSFVSDVSDTNWSSSRPRKDYLSLKPWLTMLTDKARCFALHYVDN